MLSDLTQLGHSSSFGLRSDLPIQSEEHPRSFYRSICVQGSQQWLDGGSHELNVGPPRDRGATRWKAALSRVAPACRSDKCGLVIATTFSFLTLTDLLSRPSPSPPPNFIHSAPVKTFLRHNHYHTTPNFYNSTQTLPLLPKVRIRFNF